MEQRHGMFTIHAELHVAIAGTGKAFHPVLNLLRRSDFTEAFPWVKLVAALLDPAEDLPPLPQAEGIARFTSADAMFAAHPSLRMVLDLSDTSTHLPHLRATAPAGVSLLGADAAMAFHDILASEQLCTTCNLRLEKARGLFATLIDQVDEDILLLDTEGHILDMNRNLLLRKGGTKEDWLGLCCRELDGEGFCCPADRGGCPIHQTLTTARKAERIHTRVDASGRALYYRIYTYPVTDNQGRITSVIEIRRDITSRTNMELRLQQSEKLAAIGELATYIAHEIRNPLFAIGGFANSLLRAPSLDETARGKVQIILEESRRLDNILKSILNFARPTNAKSGTTDVNLLSRQTLELMAFGFDARAITMHLDLAPELPRVQGDSELLKQCLINMVKNAQEAMPNGGTLTVRTGMTQTHVYVTVEDTGIGIPVDMHDKIFNPFFSTKEKGAGIGLAMTRKIVEDLGGWVDLASQVGKGTTLTLHLQPVLAVDDLPPQHHAPDTPAGE